MSKMMRLVLSFGLVVGFVAGFWPSTPNMPQVLAQSTTTGDWKATLTKDNSKLQLSLERRTERGGHSQHGQTYEFTDLQGLSRETALNGGPVRFSLVREAGRIDLEGSFQNSRGTSSDRQVAIDSQNEGVNADTQGNRGGNNSLGGERRPSGTGNADTSNRGESFGNH